MRITKKIIAVILALVTALTVSAVSASAIDAPTFSIRVASESGTKAVVIIALEKGFFNNADVQLVTSSAVKSCTSFVTTKSYQDVAMDYILNHGATVSLAMNPNTKDSSLASTKAFNAKLDLYEVTLEKKTTAPLTADDLDLFIESCGIENDDQSSGNKNLEIKDFVKVQKIFNTFKLNDTSISLNYKKSTTLSFESTYAPEELTWTSSNEKVATVDENGKVYASGTGNATITVTSADGKVNESCEVKVSYQWWEWIIVIVLFGWIWY